MLLHRGEQGLIFLKNAFIYFLTCCLGHVETLLWLKRALGLISGFHSCQS